MEIRLSCRNIQGNVKMKCQHSKKDVKNIRKECQYIQKKNVEACQNILNYVYFSKLSKSARSVKNMPENHKN